MQTPGILCASLLWQHVLVLNQMKKTSVYAYYDYTTLYLYNQVRGQDNRGDDDDERQLMDENPIIVLMEFGKLMGFRLMDLFAALDKDGSKSLDHDEIRTGLRVGSSYI